VPRSLARTLHHVHRTLTLIHVYRYGFGKGPEVCIEWMVRNCLDMGWKVTVYAQVMSKVAQPDIEVTSDATVFDREFDLGVMHLPEPTRTQQNDQDSQVT